MPSGRKLFSHLVKASAFKNCIILAHKRYSRNTRHFMEPECSLEPGRKMQLFCKKIVVIEKCRYDLTQAGISHKKI